MRCLDSGEIQRYAQGTMRDAEADRVTEHLVSCKRCRNAVAMVRGETDPRGRRSPADEGASASMLRVQCSRCQARYAIPRERVRGRMLKIRCKNCSNIIEVTKELSAADKSVIERGKKLWFLVIRRQRVGPMTEQEVRERFQRGEIKRKTYAWRQGFAKWERLRAIPEFEDLVDPPAGAVRIPGRRRDPDRTEKAPRPDQPALASESSELGFDEKQTAYRAGGLVGEETAVRHIDPERDASLKEAFRPDAGESVDDGRDTAQRTAYRPDEGAASSGVRTAYRPDAGAAPDGQVTHIHLKDDAPVNLGAASPESVQSMDEAAQETWEREFDAPTPAEPAIAEAAAAAPEAQPSPRMDSGAWERHMKGQRRENSVLFSLSHLQKLAETPERAGSDPGSARGAAPSPDTGLFRIKSIAGPPAPAILLPQETPERSGAGLGTVLVVAFIGVILGAGVLLGLLYLVQPRLVQALLTGEEAAVAAGAPAAGAEGQGAGAPPARPAPAATPVAPPDAGPTPTVAAAAPAPADAGGAADASGPDRAVLAASDPVRPGDDTVSKRKPRKRSARTRRRRPRRRRRRAAPPPIKVEDPDEGEDDELARLEKQVEDSAPPPEQPSAAPPAKDPGGSDSKGGGPSDLDDLIDGATKGKLPAERAKDPKPDPPPTGEGSEGGGTPPSGDKRPKGLSRQQVAAGMKKANPGIKACYRLYREAGLVTVKATINGATGRVTRASIVGSFAGSQVGACVLAAVKANTSFPTFSGPPLTLEYPYMLR